MLTHDALVASARATSARLDVDTATDRWLACLPLAHIGGLSVVTRALLTGTALTVQPSFDPGAVEAATRAGATLVSLVPTMLNRVDASGFRRVLLGGAPPLGPRPENVVATYGLTETGSGVVYDGVALDGVDVRVGDDGEIFVRGPMLLRCYRDGTDPKDGDGWFATGDAGLRGRRGRPVGRRSHRRRDQHRRREGVARVGRGGAARRVRASPRSAWPSVRIPSGASAWWRSSCRRMRARPRRWTSCALTRATTFPPTRRPSELVLVESLPRTASGKLRRVDLV